MKIVYIFNVYLFILLNFLNDFFFGWRNLDLRKFQNKKKEMEILFKLDQTRIYKKYFMYFILPKVANF